MPPPNWSTSVNVCVSPPWLIATKVAPERTLALFGAKCHGPTKPRGVRVAMKWSNFMPPRVVHAPAPSTALNESGSQASSMLTRTPWWLATARLVSAAPESSADVVLDGAVGVVDEPRRSHAARQTKHSRLRQTLMNGSPFAAARRNHIAARLRCQFVNAV